MRGGGEDRLNKVVSRAKEGRGQARRGEESRRGQVRRGVKEWTGEVK